MPMNDAAKRMTSTLHLKTMRLQFVRNLWRQLTHVASMKTFPRFTITHRKPAYSRFYRTRIQFLEERRLLTGAIAGRLWLDADYDGVQDTSETQNFANISVKLERSGSATLAALTDANGHYAFDVQAGSGYHLSFIMPAGFTLSPDLVSNSFKTFTANTNSRSTPPT